MNDQVAYTRSTVAVEGGDLTIGRWGEGDRIVLAGHGITANHLSWQAVAPLVVAGSGGAVSVVAVDHRGRAGSADLPGPYGPAAHADDLATVLDHLGSATAVFAGHSMGAFVAAAAAERHPGRVERLVLVDGGLPLALQLPPDVVVEDAVRAVIGPALDRLDQTWDDEDACVGFFRAHPAFCPPNPWPEAAEAYVRYDAVRTPEGRVRSSVSKDAVLVDGGAAIVDPDSARSIERVRTPAVLVWAERGMLDQSPGLYPPAVVEAAVARLPHLEAVGVSDVNHYTILVGPGASAVAHQVLLAVERAGAAP